MWLENSMHIGPENLQSLTAVPLKLPHSHGITAIFISMSAVLLQHLISLPWESTVTVITITVQLSVVNALKYVSHGILF